MRLLFDENLSRRLVRMLADLHPVSEHVVTNGLERADDAEVWQYAAQHGLVIVSKDWDFLQLSFAGTSAQSSLAADWELLGVDNGRGAAEAAPRLAPVPG